MWGPDPLDQRLDRWMTAGRQLVDGVSGARPGARGVTRARGGERSGGRPGFEGIGRWVEDRLDWLLEDEDDWREPWQQERPLARERGAWAPEREPRPLPEARPRSVQPVEPSAAGRSRRPLDAVSRRQPRGAAVAPEDWPEEEAFQVNRWQRSASEPAAPERDAFGEAPSAARPEPGPPPARPLPRSSRRRG